MRPTSYRPQTPSNMLLQICLILVATTTVVRGLASLGNGSIKKIKKPTMSVKEKVAQLCRSNPKLCQFKSEPQKKEDEKERYELKEKMIKQKQFGSVPFNQRRAQNDNRRIESKINEEIRSTLTESKAQKSSRKGERMERKRTKPLAYDFLTCDLTKEASEFISHISNKVVNEQDAKNGFLELLLNASPLFTCTTVTNEDPIATVETNGMNDEIDHDNKINRAFGSMGKRIGLRRKVQWVSNDVPHVVRSSKAPRGDSINSIGIRGYTGNRFEKRNRNPRVSNVIKTESKRRMVNSIQTPRASELPLQRKNLKTGATEDRVFDQLELEMQQKQIMDMLMKIIKKREGKIKAK